MRKYFLGGNTSLGFFSYYDNLLPVERAERIYILKGGPGTGKSTLMKTVGEWATENGFDIDVIFCSSDPGSLDGLVIPEMKVAFVDGTSPHVVEPKCPGAAEKVISLGECWNEKNMRKNKADIIRVNGKIKEKYTLAYCHMKAAGVLEGELRGICGKITKTEIIRKLAEDMVLREAEGFSKSGTGAVRKLFASSYGPMGYVSHAHTLSREKKYEVSGLGAGNVMTEAARLIADYGYDAELFFDPLMPQNGILHIVVPELDLSIFTRDQRENVACENAKRVDTGRAIDTYLLDEYSEEIVGLQRSTAEQTAAACDIFAEAKALHDKLEGYYIPNMDFAKIGKIQERVISELSKIK